MGREAMPIARVRAACRSGPKLLDPVKVLAGVIVLLMESPQKKLGRSWLRSAQLWFYFRLDGYASSLSTAAGAALACARAAIEVCCKVCALVRLAASDAMSASRMRDCAAEKLVICESARLMA